MSDSSDDANNRTEWEDFSNEMKRTRELVNRIPSPGPLRQLEYVTNRMTDHDKDEFRRLGNNLLVSSGKILILSFNLTFQERAPNFNKYLGGKIRYVRDIIQWARVNQIRVPFFVAKDCVFIRDLQYGNFRNYYVSINLLIMIFLLK